ncbi:PilZ domain-containing protein [Sphingosinicella sp.]|uniref:PilZ domain-containing protein n=1 Tax=Sphingosinicella sp. TaxID=1917971 RepID=UPI004038286A
MRGLRVKLADWANAIRSTVGLEADAEPEAVERRREARCLSNRKVIVRQRKTLGILHLKNISSTGGCGLTDMPLAVGSLVFVELRKPHFFAAEVRWVRSLSIGLQFFRPVRAEMFEKAPEPAPAPPKKKRGTG